MQASSPRELQMELPLNARVVAPITSATVLAFPAKASKSGLKSTDALRKILDYADSLET